MPESFNFNPDEFIDWFDEEETVPMFNSGDEYIDHVLATRGVLSATVLA